MLFKKPISTLRAPTSSVSGARAGVSLFPTGIPRLTSEAEAAMSVAAASRHVGRGVAEISEPKPSKGARIRPKG
jgi:hypothetical protein